MKFSEYFTLEELTVSQEAARKGIDNIPTGQTLDNLLNTAKNLDRLRDRLGTPILVSSGYRSAAVNAAVGGAKKSQHLEGEAVDFTSPKFGTPRQIVAFIVKSGIDYDQVILEFDRWVHISFSHIRNRRQALVIDRSGTRPFDN